MKPVTFALTTLAVAAAGAAPTMNSRAASIHLTPSVLEARPADLTVLVQLWMDFAVSELTVGGGIDIDVAGAATFGSFVPSAYFLSADPAFTGHGTLQADADYEIHFGSFHGLSGRNELGAITLNLHQPGGGPVTVSLAPNRFYGGFYSATTAAPIDVTMTGVIPEPGLGTLLLAGLALTGLTLRRRLAAARLDGETR